MQIGLIFMASGSGRRFGSNKLLADVEGLPLFARTLAAYPPALFSVPAVVSCHGDILDYAAGHGYLPLQNRWAEEGIAGSIRAGMDAMAGMDGVLFATADQPFLTQKSVARVLAAFAAHPHHIAALGWHGEKGNPCLFPKELFAPLSALQGDCGGGTVLRAHPNLLRLVEADHPAELRDIDTPADLSPLPSPEGEGSVSSHTGDG